MRGMTAAILAGVLTAGSGLLRGQTAGSATAADLLDVIPRVVADYGAGEQLRGDELRPLLAPQVQAMLANGVPVTREQVRAWAAQLAEAMINQRLVLREAMRHGVQPDLEEGRRLVADQEERLGSKAFERALRLQGVTAEELAQRLAENEAVSRWLESRQPPGESATEEAARTFYEGHPEQFTRPLLYHVAHLLIAVSENAGEAEADRAREKAVALRRQIAAGTPFAALAREHSDCPSKADGGDLGPLPRGRLPEAFEEAALALEPGQISEPVRSPQGWHLIRGGTVLPPCPVPFPVVRETILAGLRDASREAAFRDLIQRLREEARVTMYLTAP